jgi:hypothetical protein
MILVHRLLQSILHDLKIQEYLAGVKALGLISKLLTCPLWHLLEDKFVNILAPKDGSKISK